MPINLIPSRGIDIKRAKYGNLAIPFNLIFLYSFLSNKPFQQIGVSNFYFIIDNVERLCFIQNDGCKIEILTTHNLDSNIRLYKVIVLSSHLNSGK